MREPATDALQGGKGSLSVELVESESLEYLRILYYIEIFFAITHPPLPDNPPGISDKKSLEKV